MLLIPNSTVTRAITHTNNNNNNEDDDNDNDNNNNNKICLKSITEHVI